MSNNEVSAIENNPPACVVNFPYSFQARDMYRVLYRDITSNGVNLQYNDRHALGQLAVMMVESELLTLQLYGNEGGSEFLEVQGDRNKIMKKNPAREALEKIRAPMLRLMKEFKMTPSSRKAFTQAPGEGGSSASDEFDDF